MYVPNYNTKHLLFLLSGKNKNNTDKQSNRSRSINNNRTLISKKLPHHKTSQYKTLNLGIIKHDILVLPYRRNKIRACLMSKATHSNDIYSEYMFLCHKKHYK